MQKVHFPHAVQFLGACTISQPYMIVTEFLPGGSLTDLFRRVHHGTAQHPNLKRATEMALDCSRGMTYLHAKKYVVHDPQHHPLSATTCTNVVV